MGSCVGMIEIDTGEAAGRPCTLCGESTSNGISSGVKRNNGVSFFYVFEATSVSLRDPTDCKRSVGHSLVGSLVSMKID